MNTSQADDSIHVIDFLDEYINGCKQKSIPAIEFLTQELQESVDSGVIPKKLKLNGNKDQLRKTRLDDVHVHVLMRSLDSNCFLTLIDLSYNEIGDKGAASLANFLKNDSRVKKLILKYNQIGAEGGAVIGRSLLMNEGIEEIDMTGNPIGNEGGMEFAAMLQVNTILTRLLLSNCKLTANALIALSTVLANTHKIRVLDISNNENNFSRLTQSLANDVMLHLSKMMAANRAIDILAFGKMGVSDFMVTEYLARAVLNNRKIARLDLRCNKITRDGGVALCQSLYKQMFLTHLNLSCCAIQDEGAEAVSVMLLHNKILTTLYLDHNRIARKGLRQLADVIAHKNRTLSSLRLWGNLWDEYACIDFAPVIGGARGGGGTSGDVPEPTNGIQRRPPSNGFSSKLTEEQQNARLKPDQVDFCFYVVDKVLHVCENEDTGGNREFSCAIQE